MTANPEAGREYRCVFPFQRDTFSKWDDVLQAEVEVPTWKPGVRFEVAGPFGEDNHAYADSEGAVVYRVVDIHKLPHPYPARVFYTRKFVDPEGQEFGKQKLQVTTVAAFRRLMAGFKYHYEIDDVGLPAPEVEKAA